MRADNSHHIVAAARRRATATRRRAIAALRRMDNAGQPISFDALAREAKVSRSWLYAQPDLRAEIDRLRASWDPAPVRERLPHRQRASDASLRPPKLLSSTSLMLGSESSAAAKSLATECERYP